MKPEAKKSLETVTWFVSSQPPAQAIAKPIRNMPTPPGVPPAPAQLLRVSFDDSINLSVWCPGEMLIPRPGASKGAVHVPGEGQSYGSITSIVEISMRGTFACTNSPASVARVLNFRGPDAEVLSADSASTELTCFSGTRQVTTIFVAG